MKKIANITWVTYRNYGTFLQAYALQQYIESLGFQSAILDDESIILRTFNWKWEIKKIFWRMTKAYRLFSRSEKESEEFFENFKNEYLTVEKNVSNIDYLNKEYDCFICGSDQIWNPIFLKNPESVFFYANFATKRKVAYAPSIGVATIPSEYIGQFKGLIQGFQFLSAREKQGAEIIKGLTGKKVSIVVDPTLLLEQEEWDKLIKNDRQCTQKYVLGYFLTPNPKYINAAKSYARQMGYKFWMLYTNQSYAAFADNLITAGPIEFLQAIRGAQYVLTDSFHGSIFSTIFRVQFITFKRFVNTTTSQNARVENLLKLMNISERFIGIEEIERMYTLKDINYDEAWDSIAPSIEDSKKYLINALKSIK